MANEKLFLPKADKIAKDANVIVAFHGLMCFAHRQTALVPFCEVGIHNDAENHSWEITVWEVDPDFDPPKKYIISESNEIAFYEESQLGSSPGLIVTLSVSNPQIDGVNYFQKGPVPVSLNDFRRMPDFESTDFYSPRLEVKHPEKFGPRVHIQSGTFYTWLPTSKKFKRHDNAKKFGKIAHVMAANIYLKEGESAALQVGDGGALPMPYSREKKYFVYIDNGCPDCNYIDFPEYYKTFTLPYMKPEYHVVLDEEEEASAREAGEDEEDEKLAEDSKKAFKKFLNDRRGHILSNDDSPCGAAGFGDSDGIVSLGGRG